MAKIRWWLAAHGRALLRGLLILIALVLSGLCLIYAGYIYLGLHPIQVSYRAALADLDGDGDLDAVLANGANEGKSESTLWINQGGAQGGLPGKFADSGQRLGSSDFQTLALGDLDGDGDLDLLLGNTWNGLEMFLNQGQAQGGQAGLFNRVGSYSAGDMWGGPHPIGLGDLDGDGDLDILTGNCCGGLMMRDNADPERIPALNLLLMNQTAGVGLSQITQSPSFESVSLSQDALDGTQAAALGDLDGDGDLDAFLAKALETYGPEVDYHRRTAYRLWWNEGAGSFSAADLELDSPGVYDVALGDLDGDGDLDGLAATLKGGQVILNGGGSQGRAPGEFAIQPDLLGSQWTTAVFLGDLNGDGSLDALLGSSGQAQIWLNDGAGGFRLGQAALRYSLRHAVALGDVDGDGDLDVFAARLANQYRVWLNDGKGSFTAARW